MGVIISIVNQKGGVGKTTSAVNISAALGAKGKKVLLVDFDPQGNATSGYGISKKNLKITSYDVVMSNVRPQEAVIATNCKNVSLIPANAQLAEAEMHLLHIASDKFIVPMQCEHYSLEGLAQLLSTVKKVKKTSNKNLSLMGIVFTMLDKRLLQSNEIMRDIKRNFPPSSIFNTVIPRNVRISEAPSHGMPVIYYDKSSKGAESYMKLAGEIIKKLND